MDLLERMVAMFARKGTREMTNNRVAEKDALLAQKSKVSEKTKLISTFPKHLAFFSTAWSTGSKKSLGTVRETADIPDHSDKVDIVFEESYKCLQKVYIAAVKHHQPNSSTEVTRNECPHPLPSQHHPSLDKTLSQHVKSVSDKVSKAREIFSEAQRRDPRAKNDVNTDGSPLFEITLHDCVLIVRCILVIWANQVLEIHNADMSETDSESPVDAQLGGIGSVSQARTPAINHPASLMDLPQVMAFA
jgi:hypothetical protein